MDDSTAAPAFAAPEWYRTQALRLRNVASMAIIPQLKTELLVMVDELEDLARKAEEGAQAS